MFKPTVAKNPNDYISQIDEPRKSEIEKLHTIIKKQFSDCEMYQSIIGYGKYHYKTKSGREGEWFTVGLASQQSYISLYISGMDNSQKKYLAEVHKNLFPKASIGKSCIRFKKLEDIDLTNVKKIISLAKSAPKMAG